MLKKLYHGLALLAMINFFAIVGLVGYMFASGKLTEERMNQIGEVLRGEYPEPEVAATQPVEVVATPKRSREEIAAIQAQREFYELVGERLQREIADRSVLNESIQLEVLRRLEEIEKKNEQFEQQREAFQEETEQEGFTQALEMYSSMDPKLAKDLLRNKEKEADVVRLFMAMDPNRRKKIVNSCKTQEDKVWIQRILDRIQKAGDE